MKRQLESSGATRRGQRNAYLDRVNRTAVSASLLGEVVEMHAATPSENRSGFEARVIHILDLLKRKKLKNQDAIAVAINFRLQALARLYSDGALSGWQVAAGEPGSVYIHPEVFNAAAEEPLIEDGPGRVAFDAGNFRRRILAKAKSQGRA